MFEHFAKSYLKTHPPTNNVKMTFCMAILIYMSNRYYSFVKFFSALEQNHEIRYMEIMPPSDAFNVCFLLNRTEGNIL